MTAADAVLLPGLAVCLALCVVLLTAAAPFLIVLRLVMPLLPRRWRPGARFVLVGAAYLLTFECGMLTGGLRLRLRRRRSDDADLHTARHEALLGRRSAAFFGTGLRFAGVRMPPITAPPGIVDDRPVILLARHAGFANTQLSSHVVINVLKRRPLAIGKKAIRSDPGLSAALAHVRIHTFRWNQAGRVKALRKLTTMAREARPEHGFILFPEGTNFTAERRRKAIDRLRERGKDRHADVAEPLAHMMPPIPAGARALVTAAPDADVVVLGHTGLEDLLSWCVDTTPGSCGGTFHTVTWRVPAREVPHEKRAFETWLHGQWRELDAWVASVRGTAVPEDEPNLTLTMADNRRRAREIPSTPADRGRYGL